MEMQNELRQVTADANDSDDEVTLHTFSLETDEGTDDIHNKIDSIQQMVTAPTADDDSMEEISRRKISQQLFGEAYAERKLENLSQLRLIDQMRQRFDNLLLPLATCLTTTLQHRIEQIRQMCSAFDCYFSETYSQLKDNCSSLKLIIDRNTLKSKPQDSQREKALVQSFVLLTGHYEQLKSLCKWIKDELKPQISTLKKHFNSQISNNGKIKDEIEKYMNSKKIADRKYTELTLGERQLLILENQLYEAYEKTKQNRVLKTVLEYWQTVESAQKGLLQSAKTLVNEYLQKYGQVYQKGPGVEEAAQIWQVMTYDSQAFFRNIWGKQDTVLEVYSKQIKNKQQMLQFFQWNWLDDVSDWSKVTQLLIIKKYKCLMLKGKQQIPCEMVQTIDGNLLFLDKNDLVLDCLSIKSITVEISSNIVNLNKKQKSIFSSNKKVIKFEKTEQTEEFMFFIQQ